MLPQSLKGYCYDYEQYYLSIGYIMVWRPGCFSLHGAPSLSDCGRPPWGCARACQRASAPRATILYSTLLYFTLTLLYSTLLLLYSTLLYSTLLYSTLLYSTLLYSTLLYSTLLYSTLLYSTLLYSTLLYSTLLYSTLLYSTLLYSTLLYSTLLYSTLLYYSPRQVQEAATAGVISSVATRDVELAEDMIRTAGRAGARQKASALVWNPQSRGGRVRVGRRTHLHRGPDAVARW